MFRNWQAVPWLIGAAALVLVLAPAVPAGDRITNGKVLAPPPKTAIFKVTHSLKVKDIPADSKKVRIWFWFPDDDPQQKLLEFKVPQAPAGFQLTRDAVHGHRYLYAEIDNPASQVSLVTDFTICR